MAIRNLNEDKRHKVAVTYKKSGEKEDFGVYAVLSSLFLSENRHCCLLYLALHTGVTMNYISIYMLFRVYLYIGL